MSDMIFPTSYVVFPTSHVVFMAFGKTSSEGICRHVYLGISIPDFKGLQSRTHAIYISSDKTSWQLVLNLQYINNLPKWKYLT